MCETIDRKYEYKWSGVKYTNKLSHVLLDVKIHSIVISAIRKDCVLTANNFLPILHNRFLLWLDLTRYVRDKTRSIPGGRK